MRGNESVLAEVRAWYLLAWAAEKFWSFRWVPIARSHEELVVAIHLSKWEDGSDWQFSHTIAKQWIFEEVREPDMDCLARMQAHMCAGYFSAVYDGKCAAVDGFVQRCNRWPRLVQRAGSRHVGCSPLLSCWGKQLED